MVPEAAILQRSLFGLMVETAQEALFLAPHQYPDSLGLET